MYVRDHQRPAFHKALGIDPSEYGQEVFAKTSELSRQIFPITLDIDNPRWIRNLKKMHQANLDLAEAENMTGLSAIVTRLGARLNAGLAFVSLMTIPAKSNTVPASTRLEPVY
jgi:magnesium-protoporphyrin IX monomethyl ester (oxidative) cyclase